MHPYQQWLKSGWISHSLHCSLSVMSSTTSYRVSSIVNFGLKLLIRHFIDPIIFAVIFVAIVPWQVYLHNLGYLYLQTKQISRQRVNILLFKSEIDEKIASKELFLFVRINMLGWRFLGERTKYSVLFTAIKVDR